MIIKKSNNILAIAFILSVLLANYSQRANAFPSRSKETAARSITVDSTSAAQTDSTSKETLMSSAAYFKSLKKVLDKDGGTLWGISMYAPTFFVEPESHKLYANCKDKAGHFTPDGSIFIGELPDNNNPANSSLEIDGMRWVMAMLPLPENDFERNVLLTHETFHYWQLALKLDAGTPVCNHVDIKECRIFLKLEWNALEAAARASSKKECRKELKNALIFREARLNSTGNSEKAREDERKMIITEGLPQYTAYKINCRNDEKFRNELYKSRIQNCKNESFVYSIAYHTGMAYGYLLDRFDSSWRKRITRDSSLCEMIYREAKIDALDKSTSAPDIKLIARKYGIDSIMSFENLRAAKIADIQEGYRNKFTKDTVIAIELGKFEMGFSPATVQDLQDLGTVYPNIRLTGGFGIIEVNEGGCLITNWSTATIPASGMKIKDGTISTADWTFTLGKEAKLIPPTAEHPLQYTIAY